MKRSLALAAALSALSAWAQAPAVPPAPPAEAEPAEGAPGAASAEGEEAALPELALQRGEVVLPGGMAKLTVPESFGYLDPKQAELVLTKIWGNPEGSGTLGTLGMLVPADVHPAEKESWGVVITYADDGHVDDEDAASIDYAELLQEMQESTAEASEERVKAGFESLELVGWAEPPHYDTATKKLYWAKELAFGESPHTLNYNIRALGKEGVLELNAVADMGALPQVKENMKQVLAFVEFQPGHRYEEFDPDTGRLAAYGIGGLVAGKLAVKAGLFKALIALLVAGKKFIIIGVVAIGAMIARLFKRGSSGSAES
ncbi:MAG: DUF2167 domain-containing protein [Myxococcaceae bacterium]|nr:DUF2167 domain-containing protein [Myxococcaceae bacterium]